MEPLQIWFIDGRAAFARADGARMSTELDRIELARFTKFGGFFGQSGQDTVRYRNRFLLWLPILVVAALAGGAVWFAYDGRITESEQAEPATVSIEAPAPLPVAAVASNPAAPGASSSSPASSDDKPVTTADAPPQTAEPPPINGLSISSQSWRRGGLGSKALVTLTLRNNNDYAVKDIELLCAFARRDGSHLTDRKRVIADTVNMKSRKTFPNMLIGFININASKAKCTAVAANRS
jgi:hypothetical protein